MNKTFYLTVAIVALVISAFLVALSSRIMGFMLSTLVIDILMLGIPIVSIIFVRKTLEKPVASWVLLLLNFVVLAWDVIITYSLFFVRIGGY